MQHITLVALLLISISSTSVFAKTYYVKNDGNDNANGTSDATAWKTINKVNAFKFATGDDVYFKADHQWKRQELIIDWAGTSANRAIIGSYYMQNGTEKIGAPSSANKPIISGGYTSAKSIGNVPATTFRGLVWVNSKNYVTIQNLMVKDSSGYGITISGDGLHNIIENNTVTHITGASIMAFKGSNYAVVRNNKISECHWSDKDGIKPVEYGSHPACISIKNSSNVLVEGNELHHLEGEGIGFHVNSANGIIRGNKISNGRYAGIYLDGSPNVLIENNIILGNGGNNVAPMSGISVAVERGSQDYDSTGNIIRNNLLAGVRQCFSTFLHQPAVNKKRKIGVKIIGNTCVGASDAVKMYQTAIHYTKFEVANNIFWDIKNGASACGSPTSSDISMHHNSWDTFPKNSNCNGTGDLYGNPVLKTSKNFRSYDYSSNVTADDFTPTATSPVINRGALHANLINDHNNQLRASSPTIGALLNSTSSTSTEVKPPIGLSISILPAAAP